MQAELIGASSVQIACKTAKLFTCLGGPTQLGHTIVSHPRVPTLVPRPLDALVLDPVQPLVIFSKIVHVYVLLGDELRD